MPSHKTLKDRMQGSVYTLIHCDGALQSLEDALEGMSEREKQKSRIKIITQINRLIDGHRMSEDNFVDEGKLPNGKTFKAIRKIPIRGYCWLSKRFNKTFFMSHYIMKKKQKLANSDVDRVGNNWKNIEE